MGGGATAGAGMGRTATGRGGPRMGGTVVSVVGGAGTSKNVLLAVFSLSLHLVEALVTYAMFALTPRSMVSLMLKI